MDIADSTNLYGSEKERIKNLCKSVPSAESVWQRLSFRARAAVINPGFYQGHEFLMGQRRDCAVVAGRPRPDNEGVGFHVVDGIGKFAFAAVLFGVF